MNIWPFLSGLFSNRQVGGNVMTDSIEVFRPNAERSAQRQATARAAAVVQYTSEFHHRANRTWIDAFADGMNRLVRPSVAFGLLYPVVATVWAPERMTIVWKAIATLPPGYWAVVGIVLPFYFGGRMQMKALQAAGWQAAAQAAATLPDPNKNAQAHANGQANAALDEWAQSNQR